MLCRQEAQNNQQETSYLEAAKGSGVTMEKRDAEYFFKFTLEASNCQLDLLTILSPHQASVPPVFRACAGNTWKQIRNKTEMRHCLLVRVSNVEEAPLNLHVRGAACHLLVSTHPPRKNSSVVASIKFTWTWGLSVLWDDPNPRSKLHN